MNRLLLEMRVAARQAPRLYFAPFVGAVEAVRREFRNLQRPIMMSNPAKKAKATKSQAKA